MSTESSLARAMIACSAAVRSRAIAASASLRSLAISCDDCASRFAFSDLCRLLRLGDQPVPLCADLRARLVGVGTQHRRPAWRAAAASAKQLVRLLLPLGDDIRDRPKEEPGENPDENEDIDGLERQRPPVDVHGLNG